MRDTEDSQSKRSQRLTLDAGRCVTSIDQLCAEVAELIKLRFHLDGQLSGGLKDDCLHFIDTHVLFHVAIDQFLER